MFLITTQSISVLTKTHRFTTSLGVQQSDTSDYSCLLLHDNLVDVSNSFIALTNMRIDKCHCVLPLINMFYYHGMMLSEKKNHVHMCRVNYSICHSIQCNLHIRDDECVLFHSDDITTQDYAVMLMLFRPKYIPKQRCISQSHRY